VVLPAKAANGDCPGDFKNRNFDGFSMNPAFTDFDLVLSDRLQVLSSMASTNPSPKV